MPPARRAVGAAAEGAGPALRHGHPQAGLDQDGRGTACAVAAVCGPKRGHGRPLGLHDAPALRCRHAGADLPRGAHAAAPRQRRLARQGRALPVAGRGTRTLPAGHREGPPALSAAAGGESGRDRGAQWRAAAAARRQCRQGKHHPPAAGRAGDPAPQRRGPGQPHRAVRTGALAERAQPGTDAAHCRHAPQPGRTRTAGSGAGRGNRIRVRRRRPGSTGVHRLPASGRCGPG